MALPITERQASEMSGTDLFYTVVKVDEEYGDPYYVRLASLMAFIGQGEFGGDVTGPDGATDNAVARFNQDGQHIQNSPVIIGDAGAVTGVTSLAMGGALSGVTTLAMSGALTGSTTGVFSGALTADDLRLYDTNASHYLTFHWNENEAAANRILNFVMGGATRTITFSGNPTLADWFDQSVKQAASPIYAGMSMTGYVDWTEIGAPGNPAANIARMYCKDDGGDTKLFFRDSAGTETELGGAGATAVVSAAVIVDHTIVRGDGGARGVQDSGITIDDSDNVITPGSITMDDLLLYDTNASHTLTMHWNEDEAGANRTLNVTMGGAHRALTMDADITASDLLLKSFMAAKGDLISATADDTPSIVSIGGTDGWALIVDVASASGMKWAAIPGTGDVVGPAGATDHAVARYDTATGKLLQDSVIIVTDAGAVSGVTTLGASGAVTMDDLFLYDTNASHTLLFHWNEDEAGANRILNWVMGGADRAITLGMDFTLPADPGADRILFWDDGAGSTAWLTATGGIEVNGTDLQLDIDGMAEIGAALVDADTFPVDDGDSGTNRKCLMSRLTTYIGGGETIDGWVSIQGAAAAIGDSFNVASVDDDGVGDWGINWDTDFANDDYAVTNMYGNDWRWVEFNSKLVGSLEMQIGNVALTALQDPDELTIIAIGAQ